MDGGNWICVQDEYWFQRFLVRKESDGVHGERNGGARREQLDETGNIIGVGGGLGKKNGGLLGRVRKTLTRC